MENETKLCYMSRKKALLTLGEYSSEHFGPVEKSNDNGYGWYGNRSDSRCKCQILAKEFRMTDSEFYLFMRYKLRLFDQVENVNRDTKMYFLSVIDILRVIGQLKKSEGEEAARKFINKFSHAKREMQPIVLAAAAFNTEYVNGLVQDNPKGNVFTGFIEKGEVKFILIESNKTKADELRDKLKKGDVKVLLDKPKPGSTKYHTVRLILEN